MELMMTEGNRIKFHFHPYDFENKGHAVEKSENGQRRRYLEGVASGVKTDQHEERMTDKCIKSFMDQANSGDILLYPDVHGIKASEDVGILKEAKVRSNGDWWISNMLYEREDGIGENKKEVIDTLWRQQCGLPPYTRPRQKGFSVEGYMPPGGIIGGERDQMGNIRKRVMDSVFLDGVILVPRPAYKDSIATAVFKALGELPPQFEDNLRKSIQGELQQKLKTDELRDKYFSKKWDLQDALESQIEKIMQRTNDSRKDKQLEILFNEYSEMLIKLIIESESLFLKEEGEEDDNTSTPYGSIEVEKNAKVETFRSLYTQLRRIEKSLNKRSI
jgi:hypothetical protein